MNFIQFNHNLKECVFLLFWHSKYSAMLSKVPQTAFLAILPTGNIRISFIWITQGQEEYLLVELNLM